MGFTCAEKKNKNTKKRGNEAKMFCIKKKKCQEKGGCIGPEKEVY